MAKRKHTEIKYQKNMVGNKHYQSERERLSEALDDKHADLAVDRNHRIKLRKKRKALEAYKKLPFLSKVAFFCQACQEDFVAPAYKKWSTLHELGTWFSMCPYCESEVYRHITEKIADPYHHLSNKSRHMKSINARDILQPNQYGFNTLYDNPYEDLFNRYQKKEEDIYNKYARFGLTGKDSEQLDEEREVREELEEIYL